MNDLWIYPVYWSLFAGGLLTLRALRHSSGRNLYVASVLASLIVGAFVLWVSDPPVLFADFKRAYYPAGQAVLRDPASLAALFGPHLRFVNLPVLAWLFAPFGALSPATAIAVFTLLGVGAVAWTWWLLVRHLDMTAYQGAITMFLFASNGPLFYSIKEGNSTHFILLMLVAALFALHRRKEVAAGLLIGLAALIKLPLLLFGIYLALRSHWRAAVTAGITVGAAGVLSVLMFGWDMNVSWYKESVEPFAERPIAAFNVQSIHGFLARIEHRQTALRDWRPQNLGEKKRMLATAAIASLFMAALVSSSGLGRAARSAGVTPVAREQEFMIVLLLALVTSPMSWTHYFAWLLLPAACFVRNAGHFPSSTWLRLAGWLAIAAAWPPVFLPWVQSKPWMEFIAKWLLPHYFAGGLALLMLLFVARWQHHRNVARE